jgi:hypothetical protein
MISHTKTLDDLASGEAECFGAGKDIGPKQNGRHGGVIVTDRATRSKFGKGFPPDLPESSSATINFGPAIFRSLIVRLAGRFTRGTLHRRPCQYDICFRPILDFR